jgi:hypothetical protein
MKIARKHYVCHPFLIVFHFFRKKSKEKSFCFPLSWKSYFANREIEKEIETEIIKYLAYATVPRMEEFLLRFAQLF